MMYQNVSPSKAMFNPMRTIKTKCWIEILPKIQKSFKFLFGTPLKLYILSQHPSRKIESHFYISKTFTAMKARFTRIQL